MNITRTLLQTLLVAAGGVGGGKDEHMKNPTVDGFLDNDQFNLDQIRRQLPYWLELVPRVHALYEIARGLIPKTSQPFFGKTLLLCHKDFLTGSANIGRRHPDDAAAITRRAIEMASVAIAVKRDPDNVQRWRADEARLARWEARAADERPKPFHADVRYPRDHPGLEQLRRLLGILSDAFIHFTPEYFFEGHDWRETTSGESGAIELPYLTIDQRRIEHALLITGDAHAKIVDIHDECLDGAFSADDSWRRLRAEIEKHLAGLAEHYQRGARPKEKS